MNNGNVEIPPSNSKPDLSLKNVTTDINSRVPIRYGRPLANTLPESELVHADAPPTSSPRRRRRNVSFDKVIVREYQITLCDHPCCSSGLPVGLDWTYEQNDHVDVDDYEAEKCFGRGRDNSYDCRLRGMRMSDAKRQHLLLRQGHSSEELKEVDKSMKRLQLKEVDKSRMRLLLQRERMTQVSKVTLKRVQKVAVAVDRVATIKMLSSNPTAAVNPPFYELGVNSVDNKGVEADIKGVEVDSRGVGLSMRMVLGVPMSVPTD